MSDPKRSLTEISHLFLSSVRERQTQGAPRPTRVPPGGQRAAAQRSDNPPTPNRAPMNNTGNSSGSNPSPRRDESIDMTPEEFARAFGANGAAPGRRAVQVSAVLGAHLNGRQFDRVKEYARHLSLIHGRVGLIELDASEFRLMSFDVGNAVLDPDLDEPESHECYDIREMAHALEEMNCDVDRWLLLVPSPRTPEAKALLRCVNHWVLLSTCDHDGVVSSYRMLKGLAESYRPRLSLALLDGTDAAETQRVYRKMSSVCQQFLDWHLEDETPVRKTQRVMETLVLCCRPTRDKGQLGAAPQWEIVANFLESQGAGRPVEANEPISAESQPNPETAADELQLEADALRAAASRATDEPPETGLSEHADERAFDSSMRDPSSEEIVSPVFSAQSGPASPVLPPRAAEPAAQVSATPRSADLAPARESLAKDSSGSGALAEVMDLPGPDAGPECILGAILGQATGEWIECPVRAPMCADARLAVTRQREMVLLAVARHGLGELRAIGQAYRWLIENRALLGMALPQFALDPNRLPSLRLLVDQADVSAEILQPMLQSEHVTVQAYRKLRWGGKTGLLLEAA